MSAFALGGRAGWRVAAATGIEVSGALHASGSGTYVSTALDSRLPGCRWDRVRLDLHLRAGTAICVSFYSAESDRGDEAIALLPDDEWTAWTTIAGPYDGVNDALIGAAAGRFLWLRMNLSGTPAAALDVRFADITYPRATSLRMLPAVYSTDAGGRDVNERLLSLFDAMHDGVKDEIRLLASVIDPRTTDARTKRDFLDWLGGWFDMEMMRAWPEHRRRAVIGHAGELFRRRGTSDGIRRFIELALGLEVHIIEGFAGRNWWFASGGRLGCSVLFGPEIVGRAALDGTGILSTQTIDSVPAPVLDPFASRANRMTVVVSFGHDPCADEIAMLQAVVDAQKPAHVEACLEIVRAGMRLGANAHLGLDAVVGMLAPPHILAGAAFPRLGVNAAVGEFA